MATLAIEAGAAAAVWAVWEALKITGAAESMVRRLFGERSALSESESEALAAHYESCRNCRRDQERQVELLQKISDATIEIKTHITRPR